MKKSYRVTWKGETKTVAEWAKIAKITPQTLRGRLQRGWTLDRAMTQKPQVRRKAGTERPCGAVTMYDCLKCPYKDCILPGSMRLDGESYWDNGGEL